MANVKGSGGPPPKKSSQRRRRNKTAGEERLGGATVGDRGGEVVVPDALPGWHDVARVWFESLASSGQSAFYESSDWALALVLAESISRELNPQPIVTKDGDVVMVPMPMKGATLAAFLKGCTALLVSEGDRRRAALELTAPAKPDPAPGSDGGNVTSLATWAANASS